MTFIPYRTRRVASSLVLLVFFLIVAQGAAHSVLHVDEGFLEKKIVMTILAQFFFKKEQFYTIYLASYLNSSEAKIIFFWISRATILKNQ